VSIQFSIITAGFVPALTNAGTDPSSVETADISLDIPSGALSESQTLALTQISPQGLAGLLPQGWSPVGVADISPHNVPFQIPASLTMPNPLGFDGNAGIILATWDEVERAWRTVADANVSADRTIISAQIPSTGQFTFILPDVLPQVPPEPVAGQLLQGVSSLLLPDPVNTADYLLPARRTFGRWGKYL